MVGASFQGLCLLTWGAPCSGQDGCLSRPAALRRGLRKLLSGCGASVKSFQGTWPHVHRYIQFPMLSTAQPNGNGRFMKDSWRPTDGSWWSIWWLTDGWQASHRRWVTQGRFAGR